MSLLKEIKKTVVEANNFNFLQAWNSTYSGYENLQGYHVLTGYIAPRDESDILLRDNKTDEPVTVPANSFPIKTFLIPEVPLQSPDLANSYLELYFYSNPTFSSSTNPWSSNFTGEELNTKCLVEMFDVSAVLTDIEGYPYIGFNSSADFTAGKIQVYMYYLPATLPPL